VEKLQDMLAYPPRGMDAARAAAYSGVSRTKFLDLVAQGLMPQAKDLGGAPRWDRRDIDAAWDALADRARPRALGRTSMDELLEGEDGNAQSEVRE
jgi:predicted DNA-binding transcriptional regulator AlpA